MSAEREQHRVSTLYAPEGRSALYQWQRRMQTRLGNAVLLGMAKHLSRISARRGHRIGARIGWLIRTVSPRHHRIVLANLRLAFGAEKSEEELQAIARACYRHMGKCLMEFIRLPAMSREEFLDSVELRGAENVWAARERGKGAVLVTAHVGNWEFAGARLAAEGFPVVAIAREQRDSALTDYILRTREATGMRISHRESAVKAALQALRQNELVGVLMDQNAGLDGVFVDFFGQLASTATGAAVFALRTGAAALPVFGYRTPEDRHVITVGPPIPLVRTGDQKQDVYENTARFTKIIEETVREHPEQYFWLHKRWKTRPPEESAPPFASDGLP